MSALPRNVPSASALHIAPHEVRWLRSSYSTGANNCVETAPYSGLLAVRDSKSPTGPALLFTPGSWAEFASAL
ncbi:DUF397 domain-containing protein [Streptomyces niveiscabiei]|uniref:DUF397 domain-containing protein n=1 Tax=Streptomyces niveiscabiei TaxID=164115 RepID=UPI0029B4609B|nr:DUF397 domain-containing protein [Streptomyces niveiscabiei]MDX3380374.1 DUF397 domain-containing protein [Streptomyces niveiscabiei]